MKKSLHLIVLLLILVAASGCEKLKKGTLEKMELWTSGNAYYSAKFIDEMEYSGPEGEIYVDPKFASNNIVKYYYYYHTDESPKSLGYTEGPHTDADGKKMWYHKDGRENAGSGGIWSDGLKSTNSQGGSSGGSGSTSCTDSFDSYTGDAQLDAYCGYAYIYRCQQGKSLNDPEVRAVCTYYNDIKTSSAPDCPYCK
jgi:hypothetical protein